MRELMEVVRAQQTAIMELQMGRENRNSGINPTQQQIHQASNKNGGDLANILNAVSGNVVHQNILPYKGGAIAQLNKFWVLMDICQAGQEKSDHKKMEL
jgi:hypothetical protein